jgi:hypothetical protein
VSEGDAGGGSYGNAGEEGRCVCVVVLLLLSCRQCFDVLFWIRELVYVLVLIKWEERTKMSCGRPC